MKTPWVQILLLGNTVAHFGVFLALDSKRKINPPLVWVYIRVEVQETWSPKHMFMDLTFSLKVGPKI